MKAKKLYIALLLLAITAVMGACKKNRFCHCIGEDYLTIASNGDSTWVADTTVVNIDRSMKCENIYEMGIERLQDGVPQYNITKVDCTEIEVEKDSIVRHIPTEHPSGD